MRLWSLTGVQSRALPVIAARRTARHSLLSGRRWEAYGALFASLGGAGLNNLVKLIVARPRPPSDLISVQHHINNGTFPAGHVLNFTAFAGFLCYLAATRIATAWLRRAAIASLILLIALMG